MDEVFPEYQQTPLFMDVFGASSLALLKHFPTPQELAVTSQEELADLLSRNSRERLSSQRAVLILEKPETAWAPLLLPRSLLPSCPT